MKVQAEIVTAKAAGGKQASYERFAADTDVLLEATYVEEQSKIVAPCKEAFSVQHGQLMVRAEPGLNMEPVHAIHRSLPLNDLTCPITINSDLFTGQLVVTFKGLPSTPHHLFEGRRRRMWLGMQGRFKRPVALDTLYFGTFLSQAINLPPSSLLTKAAVWLVNRLGGGAQLEVTGNRPFVKAPLIAAAQQIHVAHPGQVPAVMEAHEDLRLFDSTLSSSWTGGPLSAAKRQAVFRCPSQRKGRTFSEDLIWTFHIYDQVLDYSTFQLLLPLIPIDLVQVLGCQPLTIAAVDDAAGDSAFKLEIWHERMLQQPKQE